MKTDTEEISKTINTFQNMAKKIKSIQTQN